MDTAGSASRVAKKAPDGAADKAKEGARSGAAAKGKGPSSGSDAKATPPSAVLGRPRAAAAAPKRSAELPGTHPTLCCCPTCAPAISKDGGDAGAAPTRGEPMACESAEAVLAAPRKNEFGEYDGDAVSDVAPHVFVDGGSVGNGPVHWAGGNGGVGLQNVGDIQLVAPTYDGADPTGGQPAKAWVSAGGTASVTRSYRGVQVGDQGAGGYYFTARASARAAVHERLHVSASKVVHDAKIAPLEARIATHNGAGAAKVGGATRAEAIQALQAFIDWNTAVDAFRAEDRRQNTPMGVVDTADLAAPDFIEDRGAKTVGGTNFTHVVCQKGEPNPAP